MRKSGLLFLGLTSFFLIGCSCQSTRRISDSSSTTNKETNPNTNTGTNSSNNASTGNGGNNQTGLTNSSTVKFDGELKYGELSPQIVLTISDSLKHGSKAYFITERINKDTPFNINAHGLWKTYDEPMYVTLKPGEYTLIGAYQKADGSDCYTNKYDFTVAKGELESDLKISNSSHNHVIRITGNEHTLSDVEGILEGYTVYYIDDDEGTYESALDYGGKVEFVNKDTPLEEGEHTYKVKFTDSEGYYEPYVDDVIFTVILNN